MKTALGTNPRRHHAGSAVIVMIALLALILIFILANLKTLHYMKREIKLIERRQVERLQATHPIVTGILTNQPAKPTTE